MGRQKESLWFGEPVREMDRYHSHNEHHIALTTACKSYDLTLLQTEAYNSHMKRCHNSEDFCTIRDAPMRLP